MIKRKVMVLFLVVILLMQSTAVYALIESEAKQVWRDAKLVSLEKQELHRDAKIKFAANKSEENRQVVVDTGKEVLYAALDEVEAWLIWKKN